MASPAKSGQAWTTQDVRTLVQSYAYGMGTQRLAQKLERSPYAIECKLTELGIASPDDLKGKTSFPTTRYGVIPLDNLSVVDTVCKMANGSIIKATEGPYEFYVSNADYIKCDFSNPREEVMYEEVVLVFGKDVKRMSESDILDSLERIQKLMDRNNEVVDATSDYAKRQRKNAKKAVEALTEQLNTRF